MQLSNASWKFSSLTSGRQGRTSARLDALHALQSWRGEQAGRAYRLVRESPFLWNDHLLARLWHDQSDGGADSDLRSCCHRHQVSGSALAGSL